MKKQNSIGLDHDTSRKLHAYVASQKMDHQWNACLITEKEMWTFQLNLN